jgi:hypothetical protein
MNIGDTVYVVECSGNIYHSTKLYIKKGMVTTLLPSFDPDRPNVDIVFFEPKYCQDEIFNKSYSFNKVFTTEIDAICDMKNREEIIDRNLRRLASTKHWGNI